MKKIGRPVIPLHEKFWRFVVPLTVKECWSWKGHYSKQTGYGKITHTENNRTAHWSAHRVSLVMHGIDLTPGTVVDHICKNRGCVNPNHLRQVSHRFNVVDNSDGPVGKNSRKTHCSKGHPFDATAVTIKGNSRSRWCRQCKHDFYHANKKWYVEYRKANSK